MKRHFGLSTTILLLITTLNSYSQYIYQYGTDVNGIASYVDSNLTAGPLTRFAVQNTCTIGFSSSGYLFSTTYDDFGQFDFNANPYLQLVITPDPGYSIVLDSLNFQTGASSSGPDYIFAAYSYDGGNSWDASSPDGLVGGGGVCTSNSSYINYSWDIDNIEIQGNLIIRLYPHDGYPNGSLYLKNLNIAGLVHVTPALPTYTILNGDIYTCEGQNYLLRAISSDNPLPTFEWQTGSPFYGWSPLTSGSQQNVCVPNPPGSQALFYRLKVTNAAGTVYSRYMELGVMNEPIPEVNAGPDQAISTTCGGNNVQLNATINAYSIDYNWETTGDGSFNLTYINNPVYTPGLQDISNGFVWLTCTTFPTQLCSSDMDSVEITFVSSQSIDHSITSICPGTTAVISGLPGFQSYSWSNGSTNQNIVISSPGIYYLSAVTSNNCTVNDSITIVVAPTPPAGITANGPVQFCAGDSVMLSAIPGYNYQWKKFGVSIPGATSNELSVHSSGKYRATVTNNQGCIKNSNVIEVTVSAKPIATVTASGPLQICVGDSVILSVTTTPGATYGWKKYGNIIAGATSSTLKVFTPGNYKAIVTNSYGCSRVSSLQSVSYIVCRETGSGIENNDIYLYPNPIGRDGQEITIRTSLVINRIELCDITGRSISMLRDITGLTNGNDLKFNTGKLEPGVYLLKLSTGNKTYLERLVVN